MDRRKFLAGTSTALAIALAGCNSPDTDEIPTTTETSTPDDTQTPDTNIDDSKFVYEMPETMPDIAAFGYNTFQEKVRNYGFQLNVLTRTEPKGSGTTDEQRIDFKFDKGDATFFVLETSGGVNGDVQTYSTDKFKYQRFNPEGEEITYNKEFIDNEMGLFFYDGFNLIDQLNEQQVKIGEPQQIDEYTVRYPVVDHRAYSQASGHIEINLKNGLFNSVKVIGENDTETYTLEMDYTYKVIELEPPAWVKDID